jgi:hypothetical protein
MVVTVKTAGISTTEEMITPAMALRYLGTMVTNRHVTQGHVATLAKSMRNGEWDETLGDPIRFDSNGHLMDGQHRMWALVEYDSPLLFAVRTGLAPEAMLAFDQGRRRALPDALSMRGEQYYGPLAAALRILWAYERTGILTRTSTPDHRGSIPQLLAFLDRHPGLRHGLSTAHQTRKVVGGGDGPWTVLIYILSSIDSTDTQAFIHRLQTGEMLTPTSPILALRSILLTNMTSIRPLGASYYAAYVIKAWNDFRDGTERKQLRYRAGGANPEPYPVPH